MAFSCHNICCAKRRQAEIYFNLMISSDISSLRVPPHRRIFSGCTFLTNLPITTVKLNPLSNIIQKFVNFALPCLVLIHPRRVVELWLFKYLVRLGGLIISCSKLHSAVLLTSLSCIRVI